MIGVLLLVIAQSGAYGPEHERVPGAPALALERLTFAEVLERVGRRNPDVLTAVLEIARAEALVRQARASSLPQLTGNLVYTRLDADRRLEDRVVASADQLQANAQLSLPIIAPQAWAAWARASDNADVTRLTSADVRRQLVLSAALAFLSVLRQRELLDIAQRSRENAKALADFARGRRDAGAATELDDVRAAEGVASAEVQVENARVALVRAQEALGVLVGATSGVDAADLPALDVPLPPSEDAVRDRPDVVAAQRATAAAERSLSLSYTDYLPTLRGVFQPSYQNPATLTSPELGWQAQLLLSVPLYDGGLRYGAADERRARLGQAQLRLENTERQARSEVRSAAQSLAGAQMAQRRAEEQARLARRALELAMIGYRAGATTNIEVVEAERRARDAEAQVAIALSDVRSAQVELLAAQGLFPHAPTLSQGETRP